jgi:hypothetical protein
MVDQSAGWNALGYRSVQRTQHRERATDNNRDCNLSCRSIQIGQRDSDLDARREVSLPIPPERQTQLRVSWYAPATTLPYDYIAFPPVDAPDWCARLGAASYIPHPAPSTKRRSLHTPFLAKILTRTN